MPDPARHVVGLVGGGIASSLSPALHEREADELGLRYIYQLIDIDELGLPAGAVGDLVAQAHRLGFRGLNITHPCKQAVLRHLDELAPEAKTLGAVNTVVFTGGRAVGYNTDGYGFTEGFAHGLPDAPLSDVVVLGAGGAGSAVAHGLRTLGARRLTIVDGVPERAARLAAQLPRARTGAVDRLAAALGTADGLVNATPVGMASRPGLPLDPTLLRPGLWVADVVYRPLQTPLLRAARARGCRVLDGGRMVVYQAAEALRRFTGRAPDPDRMLRHFAALVAAEGVRT